MNTTDGSLDEAFNRINEAESAGYIMAARTSGGGNHNVPNHCGIAKSHAYSLLSAFTMTDAAGTEHQMLLIHNPWGRNGYIDKWNGADKDWTD